MNFTIKTQNNQRLVFLNNVPFCVVANNELSDAVVIENMRQHLIENPLTKNELKQFNLTK